MAASQLIPTSRHNELYALCDRLVVEYIEPFVYRNTVDIRQHIKGKEVAEWIKGRMRLHNPVLVRLFKKYVSLENVDNIDQDQWCAMAMDLCKAAATHNHSVWAKGGKPRMDAIVQCFALSKGFRQLDEDEISFTDFQRCLVYFAGSTFPVQPNVKYQVLSFESKVELVLKWCDKLDQKGKITSKGFTRSDSFRRIKRQKSIKNVRMRRACTVSGGWEEYSGSSSPITMHPIGNSLPPGSHKAHYSYSGGNRSGSSTPSTSISFNLGGNTPTNSGRKITLTEAQRQLSFIRDLGDSE